METIRSQFEVGDWVRVVNSRGQEFIGFVLKRDPDDGDVKVQFTSDPKGKSMKSSLWVEKELVYPCKDSINEDDLPALINLALDTKDEEWFRELTAQLPEELPF
ncbi:IDEAL domain-containing protein [Robertmurraya sp. FSL W8-0741]|uniref:IDEAL domain-containing protein n=1 Tax=Robertmurraya sp. FSL W8-0741 TaxID=2954629 RepID=UPI0030FB6D4C